MSALMAVTVFVMGRSWQSATAPAVVTAALPVDTPVLPEEAGVFARSGAALEYMRAADTESTRTLSQFHARRAYPGAPPVIPHPLADPATFGGRTCLACHEDGGWVDKFQAFAPVTPHPTLANCVQCHVTDSGAARFRGSTYERPAPPPLRRAALPGSPPPIPHDLQLRENCLACHAGPGAVRELRVTHPERTNCRQCHALGSAPTTPFTRPGGGRYP
ncbi:MAG: cytochrome C [Vicinamibacterales bacterium]